MRKLILFMHISLDGFVAGVKGEIDWVKVDDELFEYSGKIIAKGDTGLYGRKTYDMMEAYWPTAGNKQDASAHDLQHSKWYNSITKVVVSRTMNGKKLSRTKIISDKVTEQIQLLKEQHGKDIIMLASPSIARLLMKHNLIDEYWLFVNPIVLGKGNQLYTEENPKIELKLLESHTFTCGVIALHYGRKNDKK